MRIVKITLIITFFSFLNGCAQQQPSSGFVHTKGYDMVDGHGNKVLLRGVGLGNWLLPEGYMWKFGKEGDRPRKIEKIVSDLIGEQKAQQFWKQFRDNYITETDIKRIAEIGFNSVRPALNARLFLTEGESAQYIEESFRLIDNLVAWCKKYNVYVIIDMHGAPGGQTGANIDDSPKDEPELFMDVRNQDLLVELWVKIAKRYSDEPTVIAYDLLNEPLPENTGAREKYGNLVEPLYKRITAAIREVDKNHMITLEGVNWANDWSIFGQPFDGNLFYQFHYYCWNRPDNLNDISRYIDYRSKLNAPVWVGETGEKGNTIYWATTQYFETNNIGWSFWPWKKMDTRNTPYSINKPENWDQIAAYSEGKEKPSTEIAQKAFDELIENIRLTNCEYYPDVVNSIFRRVPVIIQAENYGHNGYKNSYFVGDTSQRAATYRVKEPVPIELIDFKDKQWWSEQCVVLNSGEWTKYEVSSDAAKVYKVTLKIKAKTDNATIHFSLNNKTFNQDISGNDWQEIELDNQPFNGGNNSVKVAVTKGSACFDWINITE